LPPEPVSVPGLSIAKLLIVYVDMLYAVKLCQTIVKDSQLGVPEHIEHF